VPTQKSISFRAHLHSNATDLIAEMGLQCARTANLIGGIVSQLAAYTEEGVPLAPTVIVCNSISDLLRRAGAGEHVALRIGEPMESAARSLLKSAAPLCSQHWRIYVERTDGAAVCNYGVFCGSSDPSSLTVDEILLGEFEVGFPIVRIAQSATNKVEVRTNAGSGIEFRFNDDQDAAAPDSRGHLTKLAKAISSEVTGDQDPFATLIERILTKAVAECHGALIVVVPAPGDQLPPELADRVVLAPPIDLLDRYHLHVQEGKTAVSVSRLQTATELVAGVVRSDGITLFNTTGCVVGYRGFIRSDNAPPAAAGGARTRAFESLKLLLGKGVVAVYFRSQDGRTAVAQI
jgi:hypothetical protein